MKRSVCSISQSPVFTLSVFVLAKAWVLFKIKAKWNFGGRFNQYSVNSYKRKGLITIYYFCLTLKLVIKFCHIKIKGETNKEWHIRLILSKLWWLYGKKIGTTMSFSEMYLLIFKYPSLHISLIRNKQCICSYVDKQTFWSIILRNIFTCFTRFLRKRGTESAVFVS